ncbi:MAG TPA: RES family NAD+ phosphorylase [Caulobacteraceae bacterium]|nr:RES family NAD+ phosphorylase [Caulobacteraceae bacterium]
MDALWEIESATSTRLVAQEHGLESINAQEFVFGVPHAAFINASFAYAKPREMGRFNGPGRGAWYAADDVETCLQEVIFHMADFLARVGDFNAVVEYAEMFAGFAGDYLDMTGALGHPALHPDPNVGYPEGNALADAARAKGLNGVMYPSVRHPGGRCYAALWPHAVQSVASGDVHRIEWKGDPTPIVTRAVGT